MQARGRFIPSALRQAALVLGLVLGTAGAAAQEAAPSGATTVADVRVLGNKRATAGNILGMLRTRANTAYNLETVQEDVRRLYATNQFGNVQVRYKDLPDGKIEVYFLVVENPSNIEEIVYDGAKSVKKSELETLTRLSTGQPLNPGANQVACQAIVALYNQKGRPFASCTLLEGGKPGDRRVVFSITEGPQVYVRDIEFVGNTFVSGPVLRTHVNSSRRFLGVNLVSKPYIAAMADNDVDKLRDYYRSFGYHDVKVSREVRWDLDSKGVVLVFHVNEGARYRVKATPEIVGNSSFAKEELNRIVQVKGEEYYEQAKVEKDLTALKNYIGQTGRQAAIQDRIFVTGPGQVGVQYEVQERPPARVGQIFIGGNTVTRQNVILRQLELFPSQPLSYPAIKASERNLARLNIFEASPETGERPTVTVLDPDSDTPFKDILVNVKETRTGSLLFGVGFNSDAGATGSIVLNERNFDITNFPTSFDELFSGGAFRGAGQELRVEAIPGTELQRYTFQFREPYLFDSNFGFQLSGYYYTRQFTEYDETRLGTRVGLTRRLNDRWTGSATVRAEQVKVRNVPFFAPADFQDVQGDNALYSGRVGFTRDDRDSYLRPTEGSLLDVAYEQVFGDFNFPMVTVDYSRYWTAYQRADGSGRHVLAFKSSFGYAGSDVPVFERFYAGGFRSIRGFEFRGVGPYTNGFNVGGQFMFLNSLEYQVPLIAGDNIYAVGFVDSGTVERDVEFTNYRVAAGVGLRFVVPLLGPVPIALDFGFPIVKGPNDQEQLFSFWLGFFR